MYRKLLLFVVFAFVFAGGLLLIQLFLNIDFQIISLTQFAPTIAYIITVIIFRDLFIPIKIKIDRTIIVKSLFAIIIPLVFCFIIYLTCSMLKLNIQVTDSRTIVIMCLGIIIGAIGEEIGWRSFLQPSLDEKIPIIISSIIVGIIWGLWHVPNYILGPIYVFLFTISTISFSIIAMYLLRNTQYNIVISSIFHATTNFGNAIFLMTNEGDSDFLITLLNCIVWSIFALIIVFSKKQYFFNKNVKNVA